MGLGLASRRYAAGLPAWVGAYAGDALWALPVYWLVGALQPGWAVRRRALAAGIFATGIELSQLWQAPWLQALRHTTLGALVLGQGFLWSDLACYAAGIAVGAGLEKVVRWAASGASAHSAAKHFRG
ncbi:DUF2809 domain-containing protein [Hymenobacter sp. RP-2-7]|uniref:DUF2809 domain-containing protein n=1 Tax=Hymenobacter polaris TaxID=2682546 RepID=A0A7Y0ABJ9_9BACT|nr:DUF2809 domain-containing protein [Hymenobacter polaris]NML64157.1 DUF2809 domain-containing protein [Hymenobacter polaris]